MKTTKCKHRAIIVAVHVSSVKSRKAACRKPDSCRSNVFLRTSNRVRALARQLWQVSRGVACPDPSILTTSIFILVFACNSLLAPFAYGSDFSSRARVMKSPAKSPPRSRSKSIAQSSDTLTIYGPRRFDRVSGTPATVTDQFALPSDAVPPFTIVVQNGDIDGSNRVTSATITLNGTDIFTQRDFNQNTATLTKQVSLIASNTIGVRLSSATGSFLTITITSARSALASISPAAGTQGQNLTVTLHGTNTRWVAGQTRATFGAEVAVGGAAAGLPGPVTVIDAVTATAQVSISSTASLAPRTVQVFTTIPAESREELELLIDGFKVVPVTPPGAASTTVSTLAGLAGSPG